MDEALHQKLADLRERIDALKEGRVRKAGFLARFGVAGTSPELKRLEAAHRDLDRVGVHTVADAWLLKSLGVQRGLAGEVSRGLAKRAKDVIEELDDAVGQVERALLAGKPLVGAASALDAAWPKAVRVLKVADIFAAPPPAEPPFELLPQAEVSTPRPESARVAVVRFWAERARANLDDLVGRRRDLDAAHELLLRVGSEVDRDQVRRLRMEVSDGRERAKDAPPVRSLSELFRHVRKTAAHDPSSAYRSLRGLYERAVERGDPHVAANAWKAMSLFAADHASVRAHLEHTHRSAQAGFAQPPTALGKATPIAPTPEEAYEDAQLLNVALDLGERSLEAFDLAAGCQRYFDVEDVLGQEVLSVEAKQRSQQRRVPYPTDRLEFELTSGFHEVRDFVLSDPRAIVYDVASGKQLVRAWYEDAPTPKPKKVRKTSVRVYVCDASGSMHGARSRFRDAILLAELNNIRVRARRKEPFDPLYYCFFNDVPTGLTRVDGSAAATRALRKLLTEAPAEGQTDITLALLQAFDSIREARGSDPYLARATVVLVTDGEDRVALDRIREARAPVDGVEISMSFIALGEENRDLRSLVAEQRARGSRAFYVHLSDKEITLARTEFDSRRRTLLPPDVPVNKVTLDQLAPHLEALEQVARGGTAQQVVGQGSFDALFPPPDADAKATRATKDPELLRVVDILEAIAEAAALAPAESRGGECVVLLHHLLGLYQLPVTRYLELLGESRAPLALARIRLLAGSD